MGAGDVDVPVSVRVIMHVRPARLYHAHIPRPRHPPPCASTYRPLTQPVAQDAQITTTISTALPLPPPPQPACRPHLPSPSYGTRVRAPLRSIRTPSASLTTNMSQLPPPPNSLCLLLPSSGHLPTARPSHHRLHTPHRLVISARPPLLSPSDHLLPAYTSLPHTGSAHRLHFTHATQVALCTVRVRRSQSLYLQLVSG